MWEDATHWLPHILAGERIQARFTFKDNNETVDEVEKRAWNDNNE